jgi:hypothetical protein
MGLSFDIEAKRTRFDLRRLQVGLGNSGSDHVTQIASRVYGRLLPI